MKLLRRFGISILAVLMVALATVPSAVSASAVAAQTTYNATSYAYDTPAQLSTPEAATVDARGSPTGSGDASWGEVSIGGFGVAANTGVPAIEASPRVAPWAGNTLSRLSTEGEIMYRVWGGGSDQAGLWLTPIRPVSSAAARAGLALPAENAAIYVSRVTLPAGVRMQVGTAGPAFGQPGGWAQARDCCRAG